jgi:D-alanyl-D-alanine carboxypeptidase
LDEHPTIWQAIFADPERVWTLEESVTNYTLAPYFPKGTDWHYSNTSYLLLRMIIREVSGSQISTEYRRRFFEPFGLYGALLAPEETLPANTARGWFDLDGDGDYDELPFMTSFYSMAGGGVFCSAEDLAKWSRALLHDRIVLTQQSLNQMLTFHSPCPGEPLVSGYGLGAVNFSPELFNNLEVWGHGGNALGYAAGCFYLPAYGVCIGIMDNTEEGEAMYTINDLLSVIVNHVNKKGM